MCFVCLRRFPLVTLSLFLLFSGFSVVLPFLYLIHLQIEVSSLDGYDVKVYLLDRKLRINMFLTLVSWVTQNRVSILPKLMNIQQPLRHALPTTAA